MKLVSHVYMGNVIVGQIRIGTLRTGNFKEDWTRAYEGGRSLADSFASLEDWSSHHKLLSYWLNEYGILVTVLTRRFCPVVLSFFLKANCHVMICCKDGSGVAHDRNIRNTACCFCPSPGTIVLLTLHHHKYIRSHKVCHNQLFRSYLVAVFNLWIQPHHASNLIGILELFLEWTIQVAHPVSDIERVALSMHYTIFG